MWGTVVLFFGDGLTRHGSADLVRERLASLAGASQVSNRLLMDAPDGRAPQHHHGGGKNGGGGLREELSVDPIENL